VFVRLSKDRQNIIFRRKIQVFILWWKRRQPLPITCTSFQ